MNTITVIGHGYGEGDLTLEAMRALRSGDRILLHTARCACAVWLTAQGIPFGSFDDLYDRCEDFDEHAGRVADSLIEACDGGSVVYGVFDVRDRSVQALAARGVPMKIVPGPAAEASLLSNAAGPVLSISASDWDEAAFSSGLNTVVREIDSRPLAAELKLRLQDTYPDDWICTVTQPGGLASIELYKLDRLSHYDHTVAALIPAVRDLKRLERFDFDRFCQVIDVLLDPGGCPWDRAQTHASLRPYMIEEAYEAVGAIDEGDTWHLADELGDVLLQVVLHAGIARRHGEFTLQDVTTDIAKKMIRRHSHIFGGDNAADAGAVNDLWTRNKMAERGQKTYAESMKDVPKSFPALMRAGKILKRLDNALSAPTTPEEALKEAESALAELRSRDDREIAAGEALLTLTDACRALGIDPESAWDRAADGVISRMEQTETTCSLDTLDPQQRSDLKKHVKLSHNVPDRQE